MNNYNILHDKFMLACQTLNLNPANITLQEYVAVIQYMARFLNNK